MEKNTLEISIDKTSNIAIYKQIANIIKEKIKTGELEAGEILPSIRYLADLLEISSITTKNAYDNLRNEGYINFTQGVGTFVSTDNFFDENFDKKKQIDFITSSLSEIIENAIKHDIDKKSILKIINYVMICYDIQEDFYNSEILKDTHPKQIQKKI